MSIFTRQASTSRAGTDFLMGGIAFAAIILFVGTGGIVMPQIVRSFYGIGGGPDNIIATAMLLNIALIIFCWRRYAELVREVGERRRAEESANALATIDPLTGCLNRRSMGERAAELITKARERRMAVAYMLIDLDHFKDVNDIHGHQTGDMVLIDSARRIEKALPPGALLARLGGDEFSCAFPFEASRSDTVERVASQIIEAFETPFDNQGNMMGVTPSIGITRTNENAETADGLMHRSDIAMYYSKKRGRNCYSWFDQSMENELRFRNEIESGLRRGIENGELEPHYEQQIDLSTGKLIGFEVLARWTSPTLGPISPDIFIPIAEEAGLISALSESIMRQAMGDAREWDAALTISINISPVQLRDPWLAQKILRLLVETGFPANRLEVEITETCLFENINLAQTIVGSLKNQGVKVALDDFGTGYSSLAHLRTLPFDHIKIDRSFVTSISESSESAAIVEDITRLGDSMGLPITAEGIESSATVEHLKSLGCLKGQGYLYGRPLDVHATRALLAERDLLVRGNAVPAPPVPFASEPSEPVVIPKRNVG